MEQILRTAKGRCSAQERADLVKRFRQGNLTVRQFALEHGINPGTFGQWLYRKEFRRPPVFKEVVLCGPTSQGWAAELTLKSGVVVRLDRDVAKFLVTQLAPSTPDFPC